MAIKIIVKKYVPPPPPSPVADTFSITSGGDDGYNQAGSWANAFNYLKLYRNSGGMSLRYTGVTIPQGSTIQEAFVRFTSYPAAGSQLNQIVRVYMNDVDNAVAPVNTTDFFAKTRTATYELWNVPATIGQPIQAMDTPDFASLVESVVQRAGWNSGNALQVLIDTQIYNGDRQFYAYEDVTYPAPELHITYTAPA